MPTYVYGAGNVTLNTGPLAFTINFSSQGAPFAEERYFKLAFYQQSQGDTISTIATYTPNGGPWGNGYSPLPGAYPPVRTITLPAGATEVNFAWNGVLFIGVPYSYATLSLTLQALGEPIPPTFIASSTVVGNGTASPVSEVFSPGDVLVFQATPTDPDTFVNWTGTYTSSTSPTVTVSNAPSENVSGVATFTNNAKYQVTGSFTVQETSCPHQPPVTPYAVFLGLGEVEAGDSIMVSVNARPSPWARVISAKANGVEYAGRNAESAIINFTPTGDVSIVAVIGGDRFCLQVDGGGGTGDPPRPPNPPIPPRITPDPTDPTGPTPPPEEPTITEPPTNPPPGDPYPPTPPVPPPPPKPPEPPPPPGNPPEPPPATANIDFILTDAGTDVELTKIRGVYQAKNTQLIEYVKVTGDADYLWTFGDGQSSTLVQPTHQYYYSGTNVFAVTLKAKFPGKTTYGWVTKIVNVTEDLVDRTSVLTGPTGPFPDLYRTGAEGLILRWRDDSGKWVHERKIDLNTRDPHVMLSRLGEYRIRQWELVMVDSVPQVVCYLEEEVEVVD